MSIELSTYRQDTDFLLGVIEGHEKKIEAAYMASKQKGYSIPEDQHKGFFSAANMLNMFIPQDYLEFCETNNLHPFEEGDLGELPILTTLKERNMYRFRIYHDVVRLRRIAQKVLALAKPDEEGFLLLPSATTRLFDTIAKISDRNYLFNTSIDKLCSDMKERRDFIKSMESLVFCAI